MPYVCVWYVHERLCVFSCVCLLFFFPVRRWADQPCENGSFPCVSASRLSHPEALVLLSPRTASLIYARPDVSQSRQRHHLVLGVIWGSLTELEVRTAERNMTYRRFYDTDSFPIVLVLVRLWAPQVAQHFSQEGFMKMWNQTNESPSSANKNKQLPGNLMHFSAMRSEVYF